MAVTNLPNQANTTPTPVQATAVVQTTPQVPFYRKMPLGVMATVAILVLIPAVAYLYLVQPFIPKPLIVQNPLQKIDETANWKTYTDNTDKLSFLYPPTWVARVSSDHSIISFTPTDSTDPTGIKSIISVNVQLPNDYYQDKVQSYPGYFNNAPIVQENIIASNLTGTLTKLRNIPKPIDPNNQELIGFVTMNIKGQALEFSYYSGVQDYEHIVRLMATSVKLLK